jgi:hypothetical protein
VNHVSDQTNLINFAENLRQDVYIKCEQEGDESFREDEFTQLVLEYLTDAGELNDGNVCHHAAHGVKVNGYSINDEQDTLDLFVSIYTQRVPPVTVSRNEVEAAFKRAQNFLKRSLSEYFRLLEEASPAFDMAQLIFELRDRLVQVRVYLFTDGLTTATARREVTVAEIPCSLHVWDIERLYRCVTSGREREAITIDLEREYGGPVPCLPMPPSIADYDACLAIFPGEVLYRIYADHGARLLERNVRSFLQVKGGVNKGIRETILRNPGRFLAYNNGISATAEKLEFVDLSGGGRGIARIHDLQIVNGGQTTASLYHAATRDKADLSSVQVQAKLTIVDRERMAQMVPLISRYANSQNKVSDADFAANDEFHVQVEALSRTIWAPAIGGTQRQTRWFYERARGQYEDAKSREPTKARKMAFSVMHPPSQKFTKTDLAKFMHTWAGLPYLVSRGAQKNFNEFTVALTESVQNGHEPPTVNERFFKRLIARAILFHTAEGIVQRQKFGGYRANIVTYTLAYIVQKTDGRIDLDGIWGKQDLSASLKEAIEIVCHEIFGVLTAPPGGGNITEWCKKESCWKAIQALEVALPESLRAELVDPTLTDDNESESELGELAMQFRSIPVQHWQNLEVWARETGDLDASQRAIVSSLTRLADRNALPSRKQFEAGVLALENAIVMGFNPNADLEFEENPLT